MLASLRALKSFSIGTVDELTPPPPAAGPWAR
jgi:hypothetical protein